MGNGTTADAADKGLNRVIRIDEAKIQDHLGEMVRQSVQETLNGMLDAEADQLCKARRYERSPERQDTRAGHYSRKLHTRAGQVELKVPKLRTLTPSSSTSPWPCVTVAAARKSSCLRA